MLRWMLAFGMLAAFARSMASRKLKFMSGSAPERAAIAMAFPSLVNTAPRAASLAPFSRLIVDHLECPLITSFSITTFHLLLYHIADEAGAVSRRNCVPLSRLRQRVT